MTRASVAGDRSARPASSRTPKGGRKSTSARTARPALRPRRVFSGWVSGHGSRSAPCALTNTGGSTTWSHTLPVVSIELTPRSASTARVRSPRYGATTTDTAGSSSVSTSCAAASGVSTALTTTARSRATPSHGSTRSVTSRRRPDGRPGARTRRTVHADGSCSASTPSTVRRVVVSDGRALLTTEIPLPRNP